MTKRKTTYTGKEIAALLNRKPNTISVIANRHGIGTKLNEKFRTFTEADLEKMRGHVDPYNRNVKGASALDSPVRRLANIITEVQNEHLRTATTRSQRIALLEADNYLQEAFGILDSMRAITGHDKEEQ